jgi:uncharacterized protein involved in exopolysaccharide biosynthesis
MLRLICLRVLETFFRHRWSYILTLLLPLVAAVLVYVFVPASYRVRGTIYVQRESLLTSLSDVQETRQWTSPSQATLSEVTSLINTESFVVTVLQKTPLGVELTKGPRAKEQVLEEFRRSVKAFAEGNNIVVFTADDPDPLLAQQLAVETMNAYVQWRINFERTDSEVAQAFFADQITRYEQQLADAEQNLRDYLTLYPDPPVGGRSSEELFEINRLQQAVDEAAARVTDAKQKEENARLALAKVNSDALQEYLVIDAPSVPNSPPSEIRRVLVIFGGFLALGLIIALARLALAITMDRGLYFPIDVLRGLRLPTLAMLPLAGDEGKASGRRRKAAAQDPNTQSSQGQVSTAKS